MSYEKGYSAVMVYAGMEKRAFWSGKEEPAEPAIDPTLAAVLLLSGGAAGLGVGEAAQRHTNSLHDLREALPGRARQADILRGVPVTARGVDPYISALYAENNAQENPVLRRLAEGLENLRRGQSQEEVFGLLDNKYPVIRDQADLLTSVIQEQGAALPGKMRRAERVRNLGRGTGLAAGLGGLGLAAYSGLFGG